ncbi:hypothetical protein GCM10023166_02630 [Paeniglutamicibacter cryotolerans]
MLCRAVRPLETYEAICRQRIDRIGASPPSKPSGNGAGRVTSSDRNPAERRLTLVAEFTAPIEGSWRVGADPCLPERSWGAHPPGWRSSRATRSWWGGESLYFTTGHKGEESRRAEQIQEMIKMTMTMTMTMTMAEASAC